jgi:hypothetical protein
MNNEQKIPDEYLPVVQMVRKEDSIRSGKTRSRKKS